MKKRHPRVRAWYGSRNPPDPEMLAAVESAEAAQEGPSILYDASSQEGEYADIVKKLYDTMDSLKRSPHEFRTWTSEDGVETFFEVLLDFAPADLRSRVQVLQKLGTFKFRAVDGPDQKKAKIAAIFAEPQGEQDYREMKGAQIRSLAAIWAPQSNTLLDFLINQPAQVGRVLADYLNPAREGGAALRLVGHPFADVRSTLLQPLADSKTVAFERENEIHLVTDVRKVLEQWDQDSELTGGCEQVNLLETLLLHEVVEAYLDENSPDMEPLYAHMVASIFERYLKDTLLSVAVEDFFLNWPQPSSEEIAELHREEMEQQLREMSAFLGEDEVPDAVEEDVDSLPVETALKAPPRKKVKKKVVKKIIRTKDGKKKVVRVVKKDSTKK